MRAPGGEIEVNRTDHRGTYAGAFFAYLDLPMARSYGTGLRAVTDCRFWVLPAEDFGRWVQLWRAAGDIKGRNVCAGGKTQNAIYRFPAHHFCSRRTRFNMAVNASEIAVAAHVDLQDINGAPAQIGIV